uniref:Uncharacterized protein n=1 Tax=Timema douglasi TaxID=61478 RepID=A0A7R8VM54_TIMDO|nr:unnamed protein product [Timema douglasi]
MSSLNKLNNSLMSEAVEVCSWVAFCGGRVACRTTRLYCRLVDATSDWRVSATVFGRWGREGKSLPVALGVGVAGGNGQLSGGHDSGCEVLLRSRFRFTPCCGLLTPLGYHHSKKHRYVCPEFRIGLTRMVTFTFPIWGRQWRKDYPLTSREPSRLSQWSPVVAKFYTRVISNETIRRHKNLASSLQTAKWSPKESTI